MPLTPYPTHNPSKPFPFIRTYNGAVSEGPFHGLAQLVCPRLCVHIPSPKHPPTSSSAWLLARRRIKGLACSEAAGGSSSWSLPTSSYAARSASSDIKPCVPHKPSTRCRRSGDDERRVCRPYRVVGRPTPSASQARGLSPRRLKPKAGLGLVTLASQYSPVQAGNVSTRVGSEDEADKGTLRGSRHRPEH